MAGRGHPMCMCSIHRKTCGLQQKSQVLTDSKGIYSRKQLFDLELGKGHGQGHGVA